MGVCVVYVVYAVCGVCAEVRPELGEPAAGPVMARPEVLLYCH